MALGTPVIGTVGYSAASGTTVAPTYPTGVVASDQIVLFVGQKPATANGGTVTTPTGWTLQGSLTAAGGYGTTLGADTGNTNLFVYTKDAVAGTETGTLTVTVGDNNVCWAALIRVPTGNGINNKLVTTAQQSTTPGTTISLTLSANPPLEVFDLSLWAMCVPTDVGAGASFSAPTLSGTGATFAAGVELAEPFNGNGNDIGGYIAYSRSTGGSTTVAPTVTVTAAGTLTDLRGPVVLLRIRERYTRNHTETGAASDAAATLFSPQAGVGLINTDPLNLFVLNGNRTFSSTRTETSATADSTTGVCIFPRSVAETLAATDSIAVGSLIAVAVSESAAPTDSTTSVRTFASSATETGAASEASSNTLTRAGAASETVATADSSTTSMVRPATIAESGASVDAASATYLRFGALTESAAPTDSVTSVLGRTSTITESLAGSDSADAPRVRTASVAESEATSDSATGALTRAGAAVEALAVADLTQTLFSPRGANGLINTDPLNLYVLNGNAAVIVVNEIASAAQTSSVVAVRLGNIAETGSLADSSVGSRVYSASVSESGSAADAATATPTLARTAAETLSSVDSSSTAMARAGAASESGSAADSSTGNLVCSSAAANSLAATDTTQTLFSPRGANGLINTDVLNLFPLNGNSSIYIVGENLVAADTSVSATGNAAIAVDTLSASDAATVSRITSSAAAETLTASDAPVALFSPRAGTGLIDTDVLNLLPLNGAGTGVFRYESVTAADSATSLILNVATVADTLSAADSATGTMPLTVAAAETLTASDAPVALFSPRAGTGLIDTDVLNLLPLNGAGTGTFVTEVLSATDTATRFGVQNVAVIEAASADDSVSLLYSPANISGLINSDVLNLLPLNGSGPGEFVYETLTASDAATKSGVQLASVSETVVAADSSAYSGVQLASRTEPLTAIDSATSAFPPPIFNGLIATDPLNLFPLNGSGTGVSVDETLSAADQVAAIGSSSVAVVEPPQSNRGLVGTDVLNRLALNTSDDAFEQDGIRDTVAGGFVLAASTQESITLADAAIVAPVSPHGLINTDPLNLFPLNGSGTQFFRRETLSASDSATSTGSFSLSVVEPQRSGFGLLNTDPLNRLALNRTTDVYAIGLTDTVVGGFIFAASAADTLNIVDAVAEIARPSTGLINTDVLNLLPLNGAGTQLFVAETLNATDSFVATGTQTLFVYEPPAVGFGLLGTSALNIFPLNDSSNTFVSFAAADAASVRVSFAVSVNEVIPFLTDTLYPSFVKASKGLINTDVLNLLPLNGGAETLSVVESLSATDSTVATVQYAPRANNSGLINTDVLNLLPLNGVGGITYVAEGLSALDSLTVVSQYNVQTSDSLTLLDAFGTLTPLPGQVNLYNTDPLNVWPLNGSGPLVFGVGVNEFGNTEDATGTQLAAVATRPEILAAVDSLQLSYAVFVTDTLTVAANEISFAIFFSEQEEAANPSDSAIQDYFALNAQPLAAVKVAYLSGVPFPGYIFAEVTDTGTTGRQPVQILQIHASAKAQAIYATALESGLEIQGEQ
jgi:hypothetical protein